MGYSIHTLRFGRLQTFKDTLNLKFHTHTHTLKPEAKSAVDNYLVDD